MTEVLKLIIGDLILQLAQVTAERDALKAELAKKAAE